MEDEKLKEIGLLKGKSQDYRDGFFAAINLYSDMKAAFLRGMIGQQVTVEEHGRQTGNS